ncbi:hypothetical protein EJB05_12762, partial [Eragrostis curvula]
MEFATTQHSSQATVTRHNRLFGPVRSNRLSMVLGIELWHGNGAGLSRMGARMQPCIVAFTEIGVGKVKRMCHIWMSGDRVGGLGEGDGFFSKVEHHDENERQKLSNTRGLNENQVKSWLQNQRTQSHSYEIATPVAKYYEPQVPLMSYVLFGISSVFVLQDKRMLAEIARTAVHEFGTLANSIQWPTYRNGRKSLTIVQGLKKGLSYNEIFKDLKKEFCRNGTVVQDPGLDETWIYRYFLEDIQLQVSQRKNLATFQVQQKLARQEK